MRIVVFFVALISGLSVHSQTYEDTIIESRVIHMGELIDSSTHILNQDEIDHFEGLAYFDVDSSYRIKAVFTKSIGKKFKMPTNTERAPIYRRYAYVDFIIDGKTQRLTVYQNIALSKQKEFKNYLFIPFRDSTCGNESYGGGRYLDVEIPAGATIVLDFNKIYNPYCVYSHRYSCPVPPAENTLTIPIRAGEKVPVGYSIEH